MSAAKTVCAPGGGLGKGAARCTSARLSTSSAASPLERSSFSVFTVPSSFNSKAMSAVPEAPRAARVLGKLLVQLQQAEDESLIAHRLIAIGRRLRHGDGAGIILHQPVRLSPRRPRRRNRRRRRIDGERLGKLWRRLKWRGLRHRRRRRLRGDGLGNRRRLGRWHRLQRFRLYRLGLYRLGLDGRWLGRLGFRRFRLRRRRLHLGLYRRRWQRVRRLLRVRLDWLGRGFDRLGFDRFGRDRLRCGGGRRLGCARLRDASFGDARFGAVRAALWPAGRFGGGRRGDQIDGDFLRRRRRERRRRFHPDQRR